MNFKNFIKENLVLVMGLTLPVVLMAFFMISTFIPRTIGDPPQYDMLFSTQEYNNNLPISLKLYVREGVLTAQFVRKGKDNYSYDWRRLYIYEAATKKVRELSIPVPANADKDMWEEPVHLTANMRIDTTQQAPDGYEMSYDGYSRSGLFNEIFWSSGSREVRLRKGASSVKLLVNDTPLYHYNVQFIGWVKK